MVDVFSEKKRSYIMSRVFSEDTKPQKKGPKLSPSSRLQVSLACKKPSG